MDNMGILITFLLFVLELCKGQGISRDLYRCRQMCYTKFVQDWHHCMDYQECKNMCITPPNINNYIPEAFSFLCWNSCDDVLGPFPLSITSTTRQGSLILTNIAWDQSIANKSKQCLVTWEISGGGLMGNLLTDSATVELSLWSDTVYHIQVTCRNKKTNAMRRSYKLIVDTKTINIVSTAPSSSSSSSSSSSIPMISLEANMKKLENYFPTESLSKDDPNLVNHLQVLKDSTREDEIDPIEGIAPTSIKSATNKIISTIRAQENEDEVERREEQKQIMNNDNLPSVIRSKLIKLNKDPSLDEYIKDTIYAIIGLIGILLGFLIIYISTRSSRNDLGTDKEELIRDENYSNNNTTTTLTLPRNSTNTATTTILHV